MQRQALAMLLGLAALQRSVVAPDLEMDTATSVPLDAGECLVFRVAVTPLHAAENRGLQVDYRSLDAAARPTAGYIAYGLATAHSSSQAAIDTSPAGLGVSAAAGCWASAAAVDLGSDGHGMVVDLAVLPGTAGVTTMLPHEVPTDDPPDTCELRAGSYWIYVANKGAAAIELQLQASIALDSSSECSQLDGVAVAANEDWWGETLLIALGCVGGVFLLALFIWYCVCSAAVPYEDDSDLEEGEASATMAEMQRVEQQRVKNLLVLEAEGNTLFSNGDVTGAAERYAAAAVLEPEGSARRQELEERLVLMLEREKANTERVYTLEDKRRTDQYYDDQDGNGSGTDDEGEVLGAEAASVQAAKAKAAEMLLAVNTSAGPNLKTAAGRKEEMEAREARLKGGGGGAGGFNRTAGSPARP
jgi:hypothetical protein|eukprot:COSAG06_NODE_7573_length_2454_cov_2.111253_2_plen_417_part_00